MCDYAYTGSSEARAERQAVARAVLAPPVAPPGDAGAPCAAAYAVSRAWRLTQPAPEALTT